MQTQTHAPVIRGFVLPLRTAPARPAPGAQKRAARCRRQARAAHARRALVRLAGRNAIARWHRLSEIGAGAVLILSAWIFALAATGVQ